MSTPDLTLLGPPISKDDTQKALEALARRHARADGLGMQVLNALGGSAADIMGRLPAPIRDRMEDATAEALRLAMEAAHRSRGVVGSQPGWLNRAVTTAMGAAGGLGGMPGAMAELPVTTAILLRTIQDVAEEEGFDPSEDSVRYDCVQVFAASGPLERDDEADLAFLGTRLAVTGPALNALIARVAPRLAAVLGQKLARRRCRCWGLRQGLRRIMRSPAITSKWRMCISDCGGWP